MALPDHLNPRLWLRGWLLKPGEAEQLQITAQGEPRAVGYGSLIRGEPASGPFEIERGEVRINPAATSVDESR